MKVQFLPRPSFLMLKVSSVEDLITTQQVATKLRSVGLIPNMLIIWNFCV